jgi:hypothetical protein
MIEAPNSVCRKLIRRQTPFLRLFHFLLLLRLLLLLRPGRLLLPLLLLYHHLVLPIPSPTHFLFFFFFLLLPYPPLARSVSLSLSLPSCFNYHLLFYSSSSSSSCPPQHTRPRTQVVFSPPARLFCNGLYSHRPRRRQRTISSSYTTKQDSSRAFLPIRPSLRPSLLLPTPPHDSCCSSIHPRPVHTVRI